MLSEMGNGQGQLISSKSDITTIIITDAALLEEYGRAWNELALAAPQQLPMLSYAWISSYFETRLKGTDKWLCVMAIENEELIGVLPLVARDISYLGIQIKEFSTPFDWHTVSVDFLCKEGREEIIIHLLLNKLKETYTNWSIIKLNRIPDNSSTLKYLTSGRDDLVIHEYDGAGSYLTIDSDIEKYKASLTPKTKSNLRKAKNHLARIPDANFSLENQSNSAAEILEQLLKVEAAGWKGQAGSAIKLTQSLNSFYARLVRKLAEEGWLEYDLLKTEGKLIAGSLTIKFNRSQIGLKITYDENYKSCSPGFLIVEKIIDRAFASRGITELNFLSDSPWFSSWRPDSRQYYNIRIFSKKLLPRISSYLPYVVKNRIRKSAIIKRIYGRFTPNKN